MDIGISEQSRKKIASGLTKILADTYALYLKTQHYHWNLRGLEFYSLHLLFEKQYKALAEAVDLIAERIKTLGYPVTATFTEFAKTTSIEEDAGIPEIQDMLQALIKGHETVVKTTRAVIPDCEDVNDQGTVDLLSKRLEAQEKDIWMLRSSLTEAHAY